MFRTELPIAPATDQLSRMARVLTIGSCFADSIGVRLTANKVETLANPFGTVFQPLALGRLLRAAAGEEVDWQQHLVQARGRWQSYDLHGSIGADSPVELLQTIHEQVRRTGDFLREADVVLLTLGTAWTYRLRETGELVNNCHKQPADLFVRELLTPDEIINDLAETHAYLRRLNPRLRFVLTVSPVRHLKDTLPFNSVSKSVLRLATHIVSDLLPGVTYFPAYELLVDDLRDYRFYAADMLHPSEVAEDYIWDKFTRTYFDADFGRFRKEWAAVRQSLGHRPLHAGAPEHREFLESTLQKLEQLSLRRVEVTGELQEVRTRLAGLPVPPAPVPVEEHDDEERIDIGDVAPFAPALAAGAAADVPKAEPAAESGQPRLSPEEFRAQRAARSGRPERGRWDGRDKGKPAGITENEAFQSAASPADTESQIFTADVLPTPVDFDLTELSDESEGPFDDNSEESSLELGKKKKRRSRGGAKRTARKNALRLAAGDSELLAETSSVEATSTAMIMPGEPLASEEEQAAGEESTVITKSVPVQRGGRRNQRGKAPREELYATAPVNNETAPTANAELPILAPLPPVEASALPAAAAAPEAIGSEPAAADSSVRGNRNRNRKGETRATVMTTVADGDRVAAEPVVLPIVAGSAEQPSEASAAPVAPQPESPAEGPTAAPARQQRRNKSRAVSGARTEKPAVDTPVVPVPDASQLRTQVAAGRMTGSTAALIAPVAVPLLTPAKKPASPKAPAEAPAAAPKASAKPKAPPKPKALQAAPSPVAEAAPEVPAAAPKPRSRAVKPKAATPTKAPAKPAAKPRAPRKPAKPE